MFTDDSFNGKGFSAESFSADTIDYIPIYIDENNEIEVLGVHNQKSKAIASIIESIRKVSIENNMIDSGETFEEFYEYGFEFDKNIDQWGDGCGGIWLIEQYSKTGEGSKSKIESLNRLHKKVFSNESFSAESHAYSYAYNEGHSDSRKDDGYNPIKSKQDLVPFKRVLKQKGAETFNAEYPESVSCVWCNREFNPNRDKHFEYNGEFMHNECGFACIYDFITKGQYRGKWKAEWDEDGYAEKQARFLRRLVEDAMRNGCWTNQESMEIVEEARDLGMSIVESDYFRNREAEIRRIILRR